MKIGKKILISRIVWKKLLNFKDILEKSYQFPNFFGKDFIGKKYSWKKFSWKFFLDFGEHFYWKKFHWKKDPMDKSSVGKKFHWKKFPEISNPWT